MKTHQEHLRQKQHENAQGQHGLFGKLSTWTLRPLDSACPV
jgi:hypothetical protein